MLKRTVAGSKTSGGGSAPAGSEVGVAVGAGVGVGVGAGVAVGVGAGVGVEISVGIGVGVGTGDELGVGVGTAVGTAVGVWPLGFNVGSTAVGAGWSGLVAVASRADVVDSTVGTPSGVVEHANETADKIRSTSSNGRGCIIYSA